MELGPINKLSLMERKTTYDLDPKRLTPGREGMEV